MLLSVPEHHQPGGRGVPAQSPGAVRDQHDAFPSGVTSRYAVQEEQGGTAAAGQLETAV